MADLHHAVLDECVVVMGFAKFRRSGARQLKVVTRLRDQGTDGATYRAAGKLG
ncbi:MAG TPA: hypothetical protein VLA51_08830 [Paracoccaceae bacterium]|nr:hypothetical protein [Paracoccaceae bacterium]